MIAPIITQNRKIFCQTVVPVSRNVSSGFNKFQIKKVSREIPANLSGNFFIFITYHYFFCKKLGIWMVLVPTVVSFFVIGAL
jgi:hypothetical protein